MFRVFCYFTNNAFVECTMNEKFSILPEAAGETKAHEINLNNHMPRF